MTLEEDKECSEEKIFEEWLTTSKFGEDKHLHIHKAQETPHHLCMIPFI